MFNVQFSVNFGQALKKDATPQDYFNSIDLKSCFLLKSYRNEKNKSQIMTYQACKYITFDNRLCRIPLCIQFEEMDDGTTYFRDEWIYDKKMFLRFNGQEVIHIGVNNYIARKSESDISYLVYDKAGNLLTQESRYYDALEYLLEQEKEKRAEVQSIFESDE